MPSAYNVLQIYCMPIYTHVHNVLQISVLSSAFNPIDNCPERGSLFSPYEPISLPGEDTPDRYSLGDWQNRFDDLVQV